MSTDLNAVTVESFDTVGSAPSLVVYRSSAPNTASTRAVNVRLD